MQLSHYRHLALFLGLLLSFATSLALKAQSPQFIEVDPSRVNIRSEQQMPCNNDAGVIQNFGPFIGQSNDVVPDTIFLCFGDSIFVNHDDNSSNLSGDPVPATSPGLGYAFYSCPPTATGPTIVDVAADPCVQGGGLTPPAFGFYVDSGGDLDADQWFFNQGQLQGFFPNGGQADPLIVHFAPITFDALNMVTNLGVYERENNDPNNPAGECVNVNANASFAVAYLNAIEINELQTSGCDGSFRVLGGLDQLLPGNEYEVTIALTSDPSITGTAETAGVGHDEVITFTVPQPGDYTITVEDGKSCGASRVVNMSGCDAVTFNFPFENRTPGEMFCVPLTVEQFNLVVNFSYTINYDETVLQLDNVNFPNGNFPDLNASSFNTNIPGIVRVAYANLLGVATTLPDGDPLFELCFTVIGNIGECSPLDLNGSLTPAEVGILDTIPEPDQTVPTGIVLDDGAICISAAPFFVQLTQDSVSCPGEADGCITVTTAGGQAPYNVAYRRLSPMPEAFSTPDDVLVDATDDITYCGLIAGFYAARVEDAAGNLIIDTIEIVAPPAVGLSIVDNLPSCFGANDGSIRILVTLDGNPVADPVDQGFDFNWGHTGINSDFIDNLDAPQTYEVTVTSPRGCVVSASLPLGDPARVIVLPMDPVTAVTNATCGGSADGDITVSATGGTTANGEYTFTWSTTDVATGTAVNLSGLDPGSYTVTVTDDNGCEGISTFSVEADKVLSVNAVVDNITCFGDNDGSIFATGATTFNIPNGTPDLPYSFSWSPAVPSVDDPTTTSIANLAPGNYTLTMTDDAGCSIDTTFTIVEPPVLDVQNPIITNETCETGSDGSATLVVNGGVFPYTYAWSHDLTETDSIANNLVAATGYMVTVTDANGCDEIITYDIGAPAGPMIVSFDDDFVTCPDDTDGTLTVVANAGSATIVSYQWANGNGDIIGVGTNNTISNLPPDTYCVTITASDACTTEACAEVRSPGFVVMDSIQLTRPTCPGESNGRILLFPSGGTPPYTFTWSTNPNEPGTINPLTALSAGTYTVTVTDANNCTPLIDTIELLDPPSITGSFTNLTGVSCPDDNTCNGAATFQANYSDGTTGSFDFVWSNGVNDPGLTSSTVDQLCRGPISVSVSDGTCDVTFEETITSPEDIIIGVEIDRVSCFGLSDGVITLNPSGGTGGFDFSWLETGGMTNVESGLSAGVYTAVVTDDNGCARQQVVEVSQPDELMLSLNAVETTDAVSCAGDSDGIISVFVSSSNNNPLSDAPYTWSGGVGLPTSNVATDLSPGTYSVTITDTKGCTDDVSFTIGEPTPIVFSVLPIEEPLCFGETTIVLIDTAFGGRSSSFDDFSFSVNNDGFRIPVTQAGSTFAGQTIVTVFDTVGCSASDTFSVNQPPQILVDLPESIVIELGDSLTVLNPIISPAGDIYDYRWTPGDFLSSDSVRAPTIFPFESTDYTFTVTNANGCQAFADIFVEVDANRNVYIPNVFSPNRDGRNEDFRIYACQGVQSVNFVRIFDRWGGQIFERDALPPNCLDGIQLWDGNFRGKPVNNGVYIYMVEVTFLDGRTLLYKGDVAVLR